MEWARNLRSSHCVSWGLTCSVIPWPQSIRLYNTYMEGQGNLLKSYLITKYLYHINREFYSLYQQWIPLRKQSFDLLMNTFSSPGSMDPLAFVQRHDNQDARYTLHMQIWIFEYNTLWVCALCYGIRFYGYSTDSGLCVQRFSRCSCTI